MEGNKNLRIFWKAVGMCVCVYVCVCILRITYFNKVIPLQVTNNKGILVLANMCAVRCKDTQWCVGWNDGAAHV